MELMNTPAADGLWWASHLWAVCDKGAMQLATSSSAMAGPVRPRVYRPAEEVIKAVQDPRVAMVSLKGVLGNDLPYWFGCTEYRSFSAAMDLAADDHTVDAIIIEADTPGGEASGVSGAAAAVARAAEKKPVIVLADGYLCSAGIWLASQATAVLATPSTTVGSVGAMGTFWDASKLMEKFGISQLTMRAEQSPDKAQHPMKSTRGKALKQETLNALGQLFIDTVAEGRGLSAERVEETFGKGRVWLASEGVPEQIGMIDGQGTLPDALELAHKEVNKRRGAGRFGGTFAHDDTPAESRVEEDMPPPKKSTPLAGQPGSGNPMTAEPGTEASAEVTRLSEECTRLTEANAQLTQEKAELTAKLEAAEASAQEAKDALGEAERAQAKAEQAKADAEGKLEAAEGAAQKLECKLAVEKLAADGKIAGANVARAERAWMNQHANGVEGAWDDFVAMVSEREPEVPTGPAKTHTEEVKVPEGTSAAEAEMHAGIEALKTEFPDKDYAARAEIYQQRRRSA